jgi:subtilase family serine protease
MTMTRIRSRRLAILGSAALLASLGAFVGATGARAAAASTTTATVSREAAVPACAPVARGRARCYALVDHRRANAPMEAGALPLGYGPNQLRSAYSLSPTGGTGETVAVVDAYGDPKAETDLAKYRSTYGLPACTTADGCFRKLNQAGKAGPYPEGDAGWGVETSLDLDMVSASCPNCHILLVEGNDDSLQSLGEAEDTAVRAGAAVVSNSYGAPEYEAIGTAHFYDHPGVAIVASTGDESYGPPNSPAVFADVIGVGGP